MVDSRFYPSNAPLGLRDLLRSIGAEQLLPAEVPDDVKIFGADELDAADGSEISFAAHKKYADALQNSRAGFILCTKQLAAAAPAHALLLICDDPHALFVQVLNRLYPPSRHHLALTPQVDGLGEPRFEAEVVTGPGTIVGSGVEIGRGTVLGANCVIGPGVAIGRNCKIGPGVTIECSYLGDNVIVHAGARVGAQGFGWLDHGKTNVPIPQLGRAIVQSGVEIGPNSVVDRGALGDTVIGEGTKLGGLVEIGHNSRLGRYCLIAPTTGLSGGTIVGDSVLMGAGVGTSGHLSIGSGSVVYGRAAVTKDWPEGSQLCGAPAQDIKDFWRELAVVRKLSRKKGGKP